MASFFRVAALLSLAALAGCAGAKEKIDSTGSPSDAPFDDDGDGTGGYAPPSCGSGASGVSASGVSASGASGVASDCSGASGVSGGGGSDGSGDGSGGEPDAGVDPNACLKQTFRYEGAASSVWLTGSFLGWPDSLAKGALALKNVGGGSWELDYELTQKGRYEYKFIIDGKTWIEDPMNPNTSPDPYGGKNSVLFVCVVDQGPVACNLDEFDWQDPVLYFAMVDRFYDSDGKSQPVAGVDSGDATKGPSAQYAGGDLKGVAAKMKYLADLGVTALWLSAPYENRNSAGVAVDASKDTHAYSAYHGYWPSPANISYADADNPSPDPKVESRIGSDADLRAVVEAAHTADSANGHGIKVLFDYVMKHVDVESGLYQAHNDWFYRENGKFPLCRDWFFDQAQGKNVMGWDHPYYTTHCAFTEYLAPFDFEKEAPRDWSVSDALWWAKTYGIDGYRLDAIKHVPKTWLKQLRTRLTSEIDKPAGDRFYLVGETFDYGNRDKLKEFVDPSTMLDGQFDFPFKLELCKALFRPEGNLQGFESWLAGNDGYYGAGAIMSTWIGNHDIPRAIHFASGQISSCYQGSDSDPGSPTYNAWTQSYAQPTDAPPYERLALAFAVMMTSRGVPLIYYGDEIGLAGGGDPDDRRMLTWNDAKLNEHQLALRAKVAKLAKLRGANPILARGTRKTLEVTPQTWVYEVSGCQDVKPIVVALNRSDAPADVTLPAGMLEDLLEGGMRMGGKVTLPARSFAVVR